jgi:hypothetical protein
VEWSDWHERTKRREKALDCYLQKEKQQQQQQAFLAICPLSLIRCACDFLKLVLGLEDPSRFIVPP